MHEFYRYKLILLLKAGEKNGNETENIAQQADIFSLWNEEKISQVSEPKCMR